MLWADPCAIHDGVATVQLECIIQFLQALILKIIARIFNPPVCLHQHCGPQVFVSVPPVGWTGGATACAENAFVHAIEFGSVLTSLQEFSLSFCLPLFRLKPWLNGSILFVN